MSSAGGAVNIVFASQLDQARQEYLNFVNEVQNKRIPIQFQATGSGPLTASQTNGGPGSPPVNPSIAVSGGSDSTLGNLRDNFNKLRQEMERPIRLSLDTGAITAELQRLGQIVPGLKSPAGPPRPPEAPPPAVTASIPRGPGPSPLSAAATPPPLSPDVLVGMGRYLSQQRGTEAVPIAAIRDLVRQQYGEQAASPSSLDPLLRGARLNPSQAGNGRPGMQLFERSGGMAGVAPPPSAEIQGALHGEEGTAPLHYATGFHGGTPYSPAPVSPVPVASGRHLRPPITPPLTGVALEDYHFAQANAARARGDMATHQAHIDAMGAAIAPLAAAPMPSGPPSAPLSPSSLLRRQSEASARTQGDQMYRDDQARLLRIGREGDRMANGERGVPPWERGGPPAPPPPRRSRQLTDLSNIPDYIREEIERNYASAERAGIVGDIEHLSYADRLTAAEVATRLGSRLPHSADVTGKDIVRSVRVRLGVPSQDDPAEFEAARNQYFQQSAIPGVPSVAPPHPPPAPIASSPTPPRRPPGPLDYFSSENLPPSGNRIPSSAEMKRVARTERVADEFENRDPKLSAQVDDLVSAIKRNAMAQGKEADAQAKRTKRVDEAWDKAAYAQQKLEEKNQTVRGGRGPGSPPNEPPDDFFGESDASSGRPRGRSGGGSGGGERSLFGAGGLSRFFGAGFVAYEALNIAQSYQQYSHEMALGQGNALRQVAAGQKFAEGITSIPIFGQVAGLVADIPGFAKLFGGTSPFEAAKATEQATEGEKDVVAARNRMATGFQAQGTIQSLNRETGVFGLRGSFQRDEQRVLDKMRGDIQAGHDKAAVMQKAAQDESNPYERARLSQDYEQYRTTLPVLDTAINDEANARRREVRRIAGVQRAGLERRTTELQQGALGNFGAAREAEFYRGLQDAQAQANEAGGGLPGMMSLVNQLAKGAHTAEIGFGIQQNQLATGAIRQSLDHQPLESARTMLEVERKGKVAFAPPDAVESINEQYAAKDKLLRRQFYEETDRARLDIRSDTERLRIGNNLADDPSVRAVKSDVFGIKASVQQQALSAFTSGRPDLVPDIYARGKEQAIAFGQHRLNQITPEEVDPTRTALNGPATENLGAVMSSIDSGIKALSEVPKTLSDLVQKLGPLLAP